MDDRAALYRQNAAACLEMAKTTSDDDQRHTLLLMAQKWLALAHNAFGRRRSGALLTEFNGSQMPKQ